jgi:hypothetical protein
MFAIGLVACGLSEWHAPPSAVIATMFLVGLGAGVVLARMRFVEVARPLDANQKIYTRSASARTLVFSAFAALVVGTLGSIFVVWMLSDWHSLLFASLVGSLWMATVPLHAALAHALAEREVVLGSDALDRTSAVGSDRVWLRDVASAGARGNELVLRLRDGGETHVPLASGVATTLAARITELVAPLELPPTLARAGRALPAWRADLASPDYRTQTLGEDDAERVLRSGRATRDERIGAALVLVSLGARERVERARDAFVDVPTRIALTRVLDDTIDERWLDWPRLDA